MATRTGPSNPSQSFLHSFPANCKRRLHPNHMWDLTKNPVSRDIPDSSIDLKKRYIHSPMKSTLSLPTNLPSFDPNFGDPTGLAASKDHIFIINTMVNKFFSPSLVLSVSFSSVSRLKTSPGTLELGCSRTVERLQLVTERWGEGGGVEG